MNTEKFPSLPGNQAEALLRELSLWGPTTTVVQHGACVFEFKGSFPLGTVGEGYYNLEGPTPGFHGHIRLDVIDQISFQQRQHRGRFSYAFTFTDVAGDALFKVFLGRDEAGAVFPDQLEKFHDIRNGLNIVAT